MFVTRSLFLNLTPCKTIGQRIYSDQIGIERSLDNLNGDVKLFFLSNNQYNKTLPILQLFFRLITIILSMIFYEFQMIDNFEYRD